MNSPQTHSVKHYHVYRMVHLITPADRFEASETIKDDIRTFLAAIENDPINTKVISKHMGVPDIPQSDFIEIIRTVYSL